MHPVILTKQFADIDRTVMDENLLSPQLAITPDRLNLCVVLYHSEFQGHGWRLPLSEQLLGITHPLHPCVKHGIGKNYH